MPNVGYKEGVRGLVVRGLLLSECKLSLTEQRKTERGREVSLLHPCTFSWWFAARARCSGHVGMADGSTGPSGARDSVISLLINGRSNNFGAREQRALPFRSPGVSPFPLRCFDVVMTARMTDSPAVAAEDIQPLRPLSHSVPEDNNERSKRGA